MNEPAIVPGSSMSAGRSRPLGFSAGALLALLLLGGCKLGPDYHRPAVWETNSFPAGFAEAAITNDTAWKTAAPAAHLSRGTWWQIFAEPELDHLEELANADNQQLAAAVAKFTAARATVDASRANLFPQADLTSSYTRQRSSANQPVNGRALGTSATFNNFSLTLQGGWEPDLWGRVRRQVEDARANLAASADDLEAVRLSLQAEVAADYFTLRALEAEHALLSRTVETYQRSLELTRNRRVGGIASDLDVSQAETQLRAAEAELPSLQLQRSKVLHALATLCGRPSTGFTIPPATPPVNAIPDIPVYLPSELLERRPDVASAEQRMAAANARVGVAKTAFFPRVRLNGLAGFQSLSASSWFDWPSRLWAVGPTLDLPLFTGGLNRAQLAYARAIYDETVAGYRQTVLGAFQEIEDQLAAQRLLAERLSAESEALSAAQHTLDISNNRYKAGLVTYLEVAVAQNAALTLERSVVQLREDRRIAAVGLVRALGGGWQAAP